MADERWEVVDGGVEEFLGPYVRLEHPGRSDLYVLCMAEEMVGPDGTEGYDAEALQALAAHVHDRLQDPPRTTLRVEDPELHLLAQAIRQARKAADLLEWGVFPMPEGYVAVRSSGGRYVVLPPSVVEEIRGELEPAPTALEARIEQSVAWYRSADSDDGTTCPVCLNRAVKMVNWCLSCDWRPMGYAMLRGHGRAEWVDDPDRPGGIWRLVEPEGEG